MANFLDKRKPSKRSSFLNFRKIKYYFWVVLFKSESKKTSISALSFFNLMWSFLLSSFIWSNLQNQSFGQTWAFSTDFSITSEHFEPIFWSDMITWNWYFDQIRSYWIDLLTQPDISQPIFWSKRLFSIDLLN